MNDDAGTSNVLGAILVVALGFTFMAQVQIDYEPRWEEAREASHLESVINQFSDLKAQSEKQSENRTLSPVSNPIRLQSSGRGGLFSSDGLSGDLAFTSAAVQTTAWAPELNLVYQNGKTLGFLNEQWQTSGGSSTEQEITRVETLRIRLTGPTSEKLELKKFAFVQLDVTDATGNYAGAFRAYVPEKEKHDIWIRVTTATGEILVDQELAADVKYKEHNRFWIDAMDPSWPFGDVLNAVKAPFSIELTYGFPELDPPKWPKVEYSITYVTQSGAGQEVFVGGGTGALITNFLEAHQGGRISLTLPFQQLPHTRLVLENGALIVDQPGGTSMLQAPQIQVEQAGGMTLLQIGQPIYKGNGDAVGGRSAASVTTQSTQVTKMTGTVPRFTYDVETSYPDVWKTFLLGLFQDAGLETPGHFSVSTTPTGIRLQLEGNSASFTTHDIQIVMQVSSIQVGLS